MKLFTELDVTPHGAVAGAGSIFADQSELVDAPMWYHKQGLSQTASGYGRKLNTGLKINYCGKLYRIYATCFSNAASCWFTVRGRQIFVN